MSRTILAAISAAILALAAVLGAAPTAAAVDDRAPRDVTAEAGTTGGTATVQWSAPATSTGLAGYTVVTLKEDGTELVSARATSPASSRGPLTISGLTNGSDYTFVVYARYAGGNYASEPSASVTPYTTPSSPAKPSVERRGSGAVRVSWEAPDDGGSAISSYTVGCTPTCTKTSVTTLFADLTGLTTTASYTFTVTATNARGSSAASIASDAITPFGVPTAPRNVSGTAGDGSILVAWSAPESNGGSPVTGYTATASPGSTTCEPATGQLTCSITGLINGTTYSVSVVATNAAGSSAAGQATNITPVSVPGKPTSVTAAGGDGRATVSWSAPASDGGSTITGYTVTSAPEQRTCTTTVLTCEVSGLTNGTAYTFTVRATNAVGTGQDSDSSAAVTPSRTVTAPGAPASVSASTGTAVGSVSVAWTPPTVNGGAAISAYAVAHGPSASGPWTSATTTLPASARSYVITGLAAGSSYFVRVAALNTAGTGAWAVSTSVVAKPDPNPGPVVPPAPGPGPGPAPSTSPSPSPSPSASASPSPSPSPSPSASPGTPVPIESAPPPGAGQGLVGGKPDPNFSLEAAPGSQRVTIEGTGYQLSLESGPGKVDSRGALVIAPGGDLVLAGGGFAARASVAAYIDPPTSASSSWARLVARALGTTISLGEVITDDEGALAGQLAVPESVPPGDRTLQLVGTTSAGNQLVLSLGVSVVERVAKPTITITGSRGKGKERAKIVVRGQSTGLAGVIVRPWTKSGAQRAFVSEPARVKIPESGRFMWSKKAAARTFVYFVTASGVRSNTVTIAAVSRRG